MYSSLSNPSSDTEEEKKKKKKQKRRREAAAVNLNFLFLLIFTHHILAAWLHIIIEQKCSNEDSPIRQAKILSH